MLLQEQVELAQQDRELCGPSVVLGHQVDRRPAPLDPCPLLALSFPSVAAEEVCDVGPEPVVLPVVCGELLVVGSGRV